MNNRIKIVYLISNFYNGGPTNQLYCLLNHLDKSIFDVTVITIFKEGQYSRFDDFNNLDLDLISLNLNTNTDIFKIVPIIRDIMKNKAPKILHSHGGVSDLISLFVDKKIVTLTTIHCFPSELYTAKRGPIIGRLKSFLHYKILNKIHYKIACSNTVKTKIKSKIQNDNLISIQNGIDIQDVTDSSTKNTDEFSNILKNIDKNKLVLIYCGALSISKDPLFIINCLKKSKFAEQITLIMLGNGELAAKCKKSATKNIIMTGRVSNVQDYLKIGALFVSASQSEGLPLSVLEAMGASLPVLLSDIPSHKEIFEIDPNIGSLFNLNDEKSFEYALEQLLSADLNMLGMRAEKVIREKLNSKNMSANYQEIYKKISNSI